MWYLIEDFFDQGWPVKLFTAWGWLSIVIMVASFIVQAPNVIDYVRNSMHGT
jgi:hypothetical protein